MDWQDVFRFGMFETHRVKRVFEVKPSYLVWICVNTDHKFTQDVMEEVNQFVAQSTRRPSHFGLTKEMVVRFNNRYKGGPW